VGRDRQAEAQLKESLPMPSFLHAADLHIDSPLRTLERKEGAPAARIRGASRLAFARLVDAAIERRVSFVLLAGDLYDTRPAFETYLYFHQQVDRLSKAGIPVAIVLGNHDHDGVAPRAERLPKGVHVFPADAPASLEIVPGVWVHGQSYPRRDVDYDLSAAYPRPVPGALNIGLLHTALEGFSGGHERYAPSHPDALGAHGYAYWALGHVHATQLIERHACHIVYPGNLQGRHARETGPKGVVFVEYGSSGIHSIRHEAMDDVRWHLLSVDAAALPEAPDPVRPIAEWIRRETAAAREAKRLAAVRLELHGAAPESLIRLGAEEIRESLRATFAGDESIFLERIQITPTPAEMHEFDRQLTELIPQIAARREVWEELLEAECQIRDELRKAGGPELVQAFQGIPGLDGPMSSQRAEQALASSLGLVRELLRAANRRKA
jgi:DNA repair exonuclease SbcCD nuclease subunit